MNELDLQCLEDTNARVRAIYAAYDVVESQAQADHQGAMRRIREEAIAREQIHNIEIGGLILFGITKKNQNSQLVEAKFKYSDSELVNTALIANVENLIEGLAGFTGTDNKELTGYIYGTATKVFDNELEDYLLAGLFFRDPRQTPSFLQRRRWYRPEKTAVSQSGPAIAVATATAQDSEFVFLNEMLDCCGVDKGLKLHEQFRELHAFKHAAFEAEVATFTLLNTVTRLIKSTSDIRGVRNEDVTGMICKSVSRDYDGLIEKYLGTDFLSRDPRLDAAFEKERPWYQPKTPPRPRAAP